MFSVAIGTTLDTVKCPAMYAVLRYIADMASKGDRRYDHHQVFTTGAIVCTEEFDPSTTSFHPWDRWRWRYDVNHEVIFNGARIKMFNGECNCVIYAHRGGDEHDQVVSGDKFRLPTEVRGGMRRIGLVEAGVYMEPTFLVAICVLD